MRKYFKFSLEPFGVISQIELFKNGSSLPVLDWVASQDNGLLTESMLFLNYEWKEEIHVGTVGQVVQVYLTIGVIVPYLVLLVIRVIWVHGLCLVFFDGEVCQRIVVTCLVIILMGFDLILSFLCKVDKWLDETYTFHKWWESV